MRQKFLDKLLWAVVGTALSAIAKFLMHMNDEMHLLAIEHSKMAQQVQYFDRELRALHERDAVIYRIETQIGMHETRLNTIDRKDR